MSSLCTLQQARTQLETESVGTLAASEDPVLAGYILDGSAALEDYAGYYFAPRYELHAFSSVTGHNPYLQLNDWPLVQVAQLLNGDNTPLDTTQYSLLPLGVWPKQQVRLAMGVHWLTPVETTNGLCDYPQYPLDTWGEDAIQLTGWWVFHRQWPRAWQLTALTLNGAIDASQTTFTLSGTIGTQIDVGSEIYIPNATGTDYEVMLVTGPIASSTPSGWSGQTIAVIRDYDNYTDTNRAAAHLSGAALYVWQPEVLIQHIAAMAAAAFYKQRDNATGDRQIVTGGSFGSATVITPQDLPARCKQLLRYPFKSHWRGRP